MHNLTLALRGTAVLSTLAYSRCCASCLIQATSPRKGRLARSVPKLASICGREQRTQVGVVRETRGPGQVSKERPVGQICPKVGLSLRSGRRACKTVSQC